jgi:hypothetical protein
MPDVKNSNNVAAGKEESYPNPRTVPANNDAVAGPLALGLRFPSEGCSLSETLLPNARPVNVCAVKVPSQRDGRSMNRRPGQKGTVNVVGDNYVGRYWVDVPGAQTEEERQSFWEVSAR